MTKSQSVGVHWGNAMMRGMAALQSLVFAKLSVATHLVTHAILGTALLALGLGIPARLALADHGAGGGASYTFLQAGFTQDIFGVSSHFMGGLAFSLDGDPLVNDCSFGGSHLHRYDAQSTPAPVNGTSLHTESIVPSNAGCGITNHPNGSIYTNTSSGVVRLDANTGVQTGGPFGPGGNALGIAVNPANGDLVYVGSNGTIHRVDADLTNTSVFSTVTAGNFVDGIFFDPTGSFLFMSNRSPLFRLTIVGAAGLLVQHVPMTSEPDGIAFHALAPKFVITSNTNGTITRFDFPGDDFTQVPVQSLFASGGFRGDLSQVGPDGCLYLTQAGTRYNNFTVSSQNSVVRICPGFAAPPGVVFDPFGGIVRTSTRNFRLSLLRPSPSTDAFRCIENIPPGSSPNFTGVPFVLFNGNSAEEDILFSAGVGTKEVCCQYRGLGGSLSPALCATIELFVPAASDVNTRAKPGKVDVYWTAVSSATSYDVFRSTTAGGPYDFIGMTPYTVFVDLSVTNGQTYFYVVQSVNSDGRSDNSNESAITVPVDTRRR